MQKTIIKRMRLKVFAINPKDVIVRIPSIKHKGKTPKSVEVCLANKLERDSIAVTYVWINAITYHW